MLYNCPSILIQPFKPSLIVWGWFQGIKYTLLVKGVCFIIQPELIQWWNGYSPSWLHTELFLASLDLFCKLCKTFLKNFKRLRSPKVQGKKNYFSGWYITKPNMEGRNMGFACWVWIMGNQVGRQLNLWDIRGYGLSEVWVLRGWTTIWEFEFPVNHSFWKSMEVCTASITLRILSSWTIEVEIWYKGTWAAAVNTSFAVEGTPDTD